MQKPKTAAYYLGAATIISAVCAVILYLFWPLLYEISHYKTYTDPTTKMKFILVKGGCFQMGQSRAESNYIVEEEKEKKRINAGKNYIDTDIFIRELPAHEVCVDDFYIGKYEVTNAQYQKFKPQHNSGKFQGEYDSEQYTIDLNEKRLPAVKISWEEANSYAKWLSQKSGKKYRLPTEAEWEYAARGGSEAIHFWGNSDKETCTYENVLDREAKRKVFSDDFAHHCNDNYVAAAPVGRFRPNAYGLYDMLGNVSEWCSDLYSMDYYKYSPVNNPTGPFADAALKRVYTASGREYKFVRVIRGGYWGSSPVDVRSSARSWGVSGGRGVGFRLVLEQEGE